MTPRMWFAVLALAALLATPVFTAAADAPGGADGKNKPTSAATSKAEDTKGGEDKPFDQIVKDMDETKGLFTFYRRADDNKVFLEILPGQLDHVFLFNTSIERSAGERGFYAPMMGRDFPFVFHRVGKSIQWVVKNTSFTAAAGTPSARGINHWFPDAIIGSTKLLSKPHPERKSLLVDVSELFAARDLPGFANGLSAAYAPTVFTFDKDKTSLGAVHSFPRNVIVDVAMNFQTDNFKSFSTTLADTRSVPILVKYQLSALPDSGYTSRLADDRVGHMTTVMQDFSNDHAASPYVRLIQRWRLEKQDPNAALSPPKQPIVFWIENTVPLEYRDAIREAILMWNPAFVRLGYKDAIVAKQMPDTASWDPADVRYSTVRWFAAVDAAFAVAPRRVDPFTGEILDTDISVGDGIVRNARRFGEEYLAPVARSSSGSEAARADGFETVEDWNLAGARRPAFAWAQDSRQECSYAQGLCDQAALGLAELSARGELSPELEQRLMHEYVRQVVAHEVGHTLGLRHNFHASTLLPTAELMDNAKTETLGQCASLMDYNPLIVARKGATQGHFVPVTLGPYDFWAIEYAYRQIPGDDSAELARIAARGTEPALQYATDEDALGTYSPMAIDPAVNQFDASSDPLGYYRDRLELVNELWSNMGVTLAKPGEGYQIMRRATSRSFSDLYRSLLTSSKFIGGVYTHRDHVGDPNGRLPFEPVPAAKQREALDLLSRYAFGERAFVAPAALLNQLAIERSPSLDPAYWAPVRLDYPWHQQALAIQKAILDRMYHPVTLSRIVDSELRLSKGDTPFRMADVFAGLDNAIWSELGTTATSISSLRRNLQREQLRQLIHMALREGVTVVDAGLGPVTVPLPEDATTLSRASLVRLQSRIRAKLLGKAALDPTSRAHLQETLARIGGALTASVQRKVD